MGLKECHCRFFWRRNSSKERWFENLQSFDVEHETLAGGGSL